MAAGNLDVDAVLDELGPDQARDWIAYFYIESGEYDTGKPPATSADLIELEAKLTQREQTEI